MKTCTKCLVEKELAAFSLDKAYANGRKSQCRECINARKVENGKRKRELLGIPERFRQPKNLPANHKVCSKCRALKSYEEFKSGRNGYAGLDPYCRKCNTVYQWQLRLKLYNLTEEQYWGLYNKQGGVCAICKQPETYITKLGEVQKLHIDHDHKCCPERAVSCGNCIRGLLCQRCNLFLGRVEDSEDLLLSMIDYLKVGYSELNMDV